MPEQVGRGETAARHTAEEVYERHATRVFNLARRMLGNDADAEDVVQEVLLLVVRKLGTFRGEAQLSTWLHQVTVNAALTLRRRRAGRPEVSLEVSPDCLEAAPASPDGPALERERRCLIEAAVAALPEVYRHVFVLADIEGLPNAEIADQLGMSLPAVKSRLHRARGMLRETLAPYFDEVTV